MEAKVARRVSIIKTKTGARTAKPVKQGKPRSSRVPATTVTKWVIVPPSVEQSVEATINPRRLLVDTPPATRREVAEVEVQRRQEGWWCG